MPEAKDKSENPQTEAPAESASKPFGEDEDFFGPIMTLEEAQALRKGRTIGLEAFRARFGFQSEADSST
jgi:hypothetical protein